MLALAIDLGFAARVLVGYALGLFMVVTGARHAYWAWTGRTDRLTTGVEGVFAERPASRRWLWAIGGPLVALGGLAFAGVLTWLLVG